jgi:hypothetical protein
LDIRGLFFESFVDFMAGLFEVFLAFLVIFFEDFFTAGLGAGGCAIREARSGGALFGKSPKLDFVEALFGVDLRI